MDPTLAGAAALAFAVAVLTTPAGVSGAVFLLPVQVGILGVPNPAVTPTNLVYNLIATPPAIARGLRVHLDVRLAGLLAAAASPGVVAGAGLRVEVLSGRRAVLVLIGVVLTVLGLWLSRGAAATTPGPARTPPRRRTVVAVAFAAGVLGGAYGIGGGSVIAPVLTALGMPARRVAPAALATTFTTSAVGVAAFEVFAAASEGGAIAPAWDVGLCLGAGGALGGIAGGVLRHRLPEHRLRRLLGSVALVVGLVHLARAGTGT